jgi:hypothetical protein
MARVFVTAPGAVTAPLIAASSPFKFCDSLLFRFDQVGLLFGDAFPVRNMLIVHFSKLISGGSDSRASRAWSVINVAPAPTDADPTGDWYAFVAA